MSRRTVAVLPRESISLTSYAKLELYLQKFASGALGLVLLLGRPGTGKSESIRRALSISTTHEPEPRHFPGRVLHVEGHMQPFGLYRQLWEHRDLPVVLDDLDRLYADPDCVRLLKPLCDTVRRRRLHWLTNLTMNEGDVPPSFTTTSSVILIANEWRSLNPNVRALEDRAIILHFDPPSSEVHGKVGEWFDDDEVYQYLAKVMTAVPDISMRHYVKGSQLRRAGLADGRASLLQMVAPNPHDACMIAVQTDPDLRSEEERAERYVEITQCHRATYFRRKAKFAGSGAALPV